VPTKGDHPDLIKLQAEALVVRKLFFEAASSSDAEEEDNGMDLEMIVTPAQVQ
jgi:hypothetical protein